MWLWRLKHKICLAARDQPLKCVLEAQPTHIPLIDTRETHTIPAGAVWYVTLSSPTWSSGYETVLFSSPFKIAMFHQAIGL
jgi:hypothetical protein